MTISEVKSDAIYGKAVDVHAHAVPDTLLQESNSRREALGVSVEKGDDGALFLCRAGIRLGPIRPGMIKTERRVEWMDAHGIEKQWVSPWIDLYTWAPFSDGESREWYQLINEGIFEMAKASAGRILPLGAVYLDDPNRAASEVVELASEHGMQGLLLSTHPGEVESITDESLFPFWAALEKIGMPVLLHPPTTGPSCQITPQLLQNTTGRLIDTSIVASQMILSGLFTRFPALRIILVHGGGLLPYQSFRLDGLHRAGFLPKTASGKLPSEVMRLFYFDTVTLDAASIELLVRRVGVSQVLLGSDIPFPIGDPDPVRSVLGTDLNESEMFDICCNNAMRLSP